MQKQLLVFLTWCILIPNHMFGQQHVNKSNPRNFSFTTDTSEAGMVRQFSEVMDGTETIIEAQVISSQPKWVNIKKDFYPYHEREIWTVKTFKVFQCIKGSITGDSVTFYQRGGKIGNVDAFVTHYYNRPMPFLSKPPLYYDFNQRSLLFLGNKEPNTELNVLGRVPIFNSENGSNRVVYIGTKKVIAKEYIKILKLSLYDTTAYSKFIYTLGQQINGDLDRNIKH